MQQISENKALVVGGGIGGLTAALCLAKEGWQVTVFEQAGEISEVGAGLQLSPNCTRVLYWLGLDAALSTIACVPESMRILDWKSGRLLSSTPLGTEITAVFGFPYYQVLRSDLIRILRNAASASPLIDIQTDARVESIQESTSGVNIQLGSKIISGDCLIGADGLHSTVRALLLGQESAPFTGQVAWRCLVPADAFPAELQNPVTSLWLGPGKHFVHYYVHNRQFINCVAVVEKSKEELESWMQPGDALELAKTFAGWHPLIETLVQHIDPDSCFKWALYGRKVLPFWSRGRITLLGDACHPTLPFMAQGAAMAIEDAAVLSQCLGGSGRTKRLTENLKKYESLRLQRTARIQAFSRANARIYHMKGPATWLRNVLLAKGSHRVMKWLYAYDALSA